MHITHAHPGIVSTTGINCSQKKKRKKSSHLHAHVTICLLDSFDSILANAIDFVVAAADAISAIARAIARSVSVACHIWIHTKAKSELCHRLSRHIHTRFTFTMKELLFCVVSSYGCFDPNTDWNSLQYTNTMQIRCFSFFTWLLYDGRTHCEWNWTMLWEKARSLKELRFAISVKHIQNKKFLKSDKELNWV